MYLEHQMFSGKKGENVWRLIYWHTNFLIQFDPDILPICGNDRGLGLL